MCLPKIDLLFIFILGTWFGCGLVCLLDKIDDDRKKR
jgi:hypothetical protein